MTFVTYRTGDESPRAGVLASAQLLAPVPQPPQMRDFLCFEKHLIQAFQAIGRMRAQRATDPAAALADMEATVELEVERLGILRNRVLKDRSDRQTMPRP